MELLDREQERALDVLRETGYEGWITVETDGWPGDPGEGARRSIARLRELLALAA